jgi:uncharacterized membrane protein YccC
MSEKTTANSTRPNQISETILYALALAVSCAISYWLTTHLLVRAYSVSRDDDLLGGMWAVAATVFVLRYTYEQSVHAALSRMAATSVSSLLCLVYLLIFPFHLWGLAALIGIGTVVVALLGRPDNTITTGITTTVVMVVAALSPHEAWRQPILRMADTLIGIGVGVAAALMSLKVSHRHPRALPDPAGAPQ